MLHGKSDNISEAVQDTKEDL